MKYFDNAAHSKTDTTDTDNLLKLELEYAGVPLMEGKESLLVRLSDHEVKTCVIGELHSWVFIRRWHYWVVEGPGLDFALSMELWKAHGKHVRANGDGQGRSPWLWNKGFATTMYHTDTWQGLKAFADMLKIRYAASAAVAESYGVLVGE